MLRNVFCYNFIHVVQLVSVELSIQLHIGFILFSWMFSNFSFFWRDVQLKQSAFVEIEHTLIAWVCAVSNKTCTKSNTFLRKKLVGKIQHIYYITNKIISFKNLYALNVYFQGYSTFSWNVLNFQHLLTQGV